MFAQPTSENRDEMILMVAMTCERLTKLMNLLNRFLIEATNIISSRFSFEAMGDEWGQYQLDI